jgi:DNA-binding NarL/FixJ family response regulator
MPISLLVASPDPHFRESITESLLNVPTARMISEYPEVSSNLYIRVLQDLERHPDAALIIDLASDPEGALKVMEKVKQAAPDLYVIASTYHADGETVIASVRAGANDFLV